MDPENIEFICKNLKIGWKGPLGIHTHNNKKDMLLLTQLPQLKMALVG